MGGFVGAQAVRPRGVPRPPRQGRGLLGRRRRERLLAGATVEFATRPDGAIHTVRVDLASSPAYRGTITGLRFDPIPSGGDGEEVRVESISWRPGGGRQERDPK